MINSPSPTRLLLVVLLLTASRAFSAEPPQLAGAVDDNAVEKHIIDEGIKLMDAGRTVPAQRLIDQLKHTSPVAIPVVASPSVSLTPPQIYRQRRDSVVILSGLDKPPGSKDWQTSVATGFVVAPGGIIFTCYHVVSAHDQATLLATTRTGQVCPVTRVLAASQRDDLAIVQAPGLDAPPLPLSTDAPVGSDVCVISHPDGRYFSLTRGSVTRYSILPTDEGNSALLETSADFAGGSSGGPVFNDRGAVVGIVTSTTAAYSDAPDPPANPAPNNPAPQNKLKNSPPKNAPPKTNPAPNGTNNPDNGGPEIQMVFKECVPAALLIKLIKPAP